MASNPMQRKARNSFLLGMIVTLLITGVIIAFLLLMLKQKDDIIKEEQQSKKEVYTLITNVKAGQVITQDMLKPVSINSESIPSNATSVAQVIDSWFLQTKEGEMLYTDKYGQLYLNRSSEDKASDTIIEVLKNNGEITQDSKGNKVANGEYYVDVNGTVEKVNPTSTAIQTDEEGMFFVDTQGKDKITRVYQEPLTDEFYVYKIDTSTMNESGNKTRVKEYIDIKNVPVLAKVDMYKNTVITSELVVQSSEVVTDDTRQEEYNMIVLPLDLMTDDYVDIRLMTPNGENFIIVSKARVEVPMNSDGTYVSDTIKVNLREDEILSMSSAIVEAYGLKGSKIYVTKYADPAMQKAAIPTYVPNAAVTAQLGPVTENGRLVGFSNQNLLDIAIQELKQRYTKLNTDARNDYLQQYINSVDRNEYNQNIQSGVEKNTGTSITARKRYLDSLNSLN